MKDYFVCEWVLGFVCLGLALAFPIRQFVKKDIEWGWDIVSYVLVTVVLLTYTRFFEEPLSAAFESLAVFDEWQTRTFSPLSPILTVVIYMVLADFGVYWAHRALHSRWLWSQHAWHHATRCIYFLSGMRGTVVHSLLTLLPYTLAALLVPVFAYSHLIIYIMALEILNQHYLHSNIHVPGARWLEKVLVTPRMHLVHHHANPVRTNSNYGFIFSIWDRMFGTFTDPDTVSGEEPLGLDYPASNWKMLLGLPSRLE